MYVWIWRHLPGPFVLRVLQTVTLLAAAVALLFFVVFPEVESLLPYQDVTVNHSEPTVTPSP